jgi:hypothetical protein
MKSKQANRLNGYRITFDHNPGDIDIFVSSSNEPEQIANEYIQAKMNPLEVNNILRDWELIPEQTKAYKHDRDSHTVVIHRTKHNAFMTTTLIIKKL